MRLELWPEGTRAAILLNRLFLAGIVALLGYMLLGGWIGLAVAVGAPAAGVVAAFLEAVPHLVLDEDGISEMRRKKVNRIAYTSVRRIDTDWIPYRDSVLNIRSSSSVIQVRLNDANSAFLSAFGEALKASGVRVDASDAAARALGWRAS